MAAEACRGGHVTIGGQPAKPSRDLHVNEVVVVRKDGLTLQFKVLRLLERRVGASAAVAYCENQTAPAEYERARLERLERRLSAPLPPKRAWTRPRKK
jgi:ribosome-associated heat shock protein Hsp15